MYLSTAILQTALEVWCEGRRGQGFLNHFVQLRTLMMRFCMGKAFFHAGWGFAAAGMNLHVCVFTGTLLQVKLECFTRLGSHELRLPLSLCGTVITVAIQYLGSRDVLLTPGAWSTALPVLHQKMRSSHFGVGVGHLVNLPLDA